MGEGFAFRRVRRRHGDRGGGVVAFRGGGAGMIKAWDALTDEWKTVVGVIVLIVEALLLWG